MNIFQVKALVVCSFMCSLGCAMNVGIFSGNPVQSPETFRFNLPEDLIGESEIVESSDKSYMDAATGGLNQPAANIDATAGGLNKVSDTTMPDQWILDGEF